MEKRNHGYGHSDSPPLRPRPKMVHYPFWLGGVAASMAASVTHPLDLTKVRMQTTATVSTRAPTTLHVLRATIAETGILSLYAGLSASLLRQMSYSVVRFGTYERVKSWFSGGGQLTPLQLIVSGGVAGGLGGIAGNPADVLLVRMTTDSIKPPVLRHGYSHALDGLVRLVREEGISGLGRGLGANTLRSVLMNASQLSSYDWFKSQLLRYPIFGYQFQDGLLLHAVASGLSGTVATTICSPADVLKARMMASTCSTSVWGILRQSLREEGPGFLFKGWTPAFVRLVPNTVLLFVFLEQLKSTWASWPSK